MPRRSGTYFKKHSGTGTHRNMHSGKRGHQKKSRRRRTYPPSSFLYAHSTYEQAVAAVEHANRLTALMLRSGTTS